MAEYVNLEDAWAEETDKEVAERQKGDISQENWNTNLNLKKVSMRFKGRYRETIFDLIKVLIAISALFTFMVSIGLFYLTVAIESTVIFLTFLPSLYEKIVSGERIFSYRERSANKRLRYRILEELEYIMKKQI